MQCSRKRFGFQISVLPKKVEILPKYTAGPEGRYQRLLWPTPGPAPGTPVLASNLPRCNFKWLRWALLRWQTKLAMNAEAGELPSEARGRGGGKTADQASVAKLAT